MHASHDSISGRTDVGIAALPRNVPQRMPWVATVASLSGPPAAQPLKHSAASWNLIFHRSQAVTY